MSRFRLALVVVVGLLAACGGRSADEAVIPAASTTTASPTTTRTTVTTTTIRPTTAPAPSSVSTTVVEPTVVSTTSVPVPWDEIGPGWFLVMISHRPPDVDGQYDYELLVVSPTGTTYTAARWFDQGDGVRRELGVLDWTEDGRRVLMRRWLTAAGAGNDSTELVDLDLDSGVERVVARFDESAAVFGSYTDPAGSQVVMSWDRWEADEYAIEVRELDGTIAATLWTGHQDQAPPSLAWPEGDLVVIGPPEFPSAELGPPLTLVRLDGAPGPPLTPPPGRCWPTGWWTPTVVLVGCVTDDSSFAQLWTVPIGGEAPEPLTKLVQSERDLGATGAWQLPDGTIYLQRIADCTNPWVDMLMPDGTASAERVTTGRILSTFESQLGLHVGHGCMNEGGCLIWFDPATEDTSVLVQSAEGEVGIETIVPWGRWRPLSLG